MSCAATLAQSAERSSHNQYTERTQNRRKRYRKVARSKLAGRTIFFLFFSFFFSFFLRIRLAESTGTATKRARGDQGGERREGEILEEGSICSLLFDCSTSTSFLPRSSIVAAPPPLSRRSRDLKLDAPGRRSSIRKDKAEEGGREEEKNEGGRRETPSQPITC
jgi:hypothetical protein